MCFISFISCQPIEKLDKVVFDFKQFPQLLINAKSKKINDLYESTFSEPFIDHSLVNPPKQFIIEWFKNNINIFGTENIFHMNIIDASIKKSEIPNLNQKKFKEKTIFMYEANFLVEFILYNDDNAILANTIVEAKRTTTSGKFISLDENEKIIDNLIYDCLIDFTKKSNELIKDHMKNFIL